MKFMEKAKNLGVTAIQYLAQDNARHNSEKSVTPGMPELLRKVAAEGAVLLENGVLPFAPGTRLAVFGRTQINWFFSGYGSGGDVNAPYQVNLLDALRSCKELKVNEVLAQTYERFCVENPAESGSWGQWPCSHPEMHLTDAVVKQASTFSPDALIVIGRCAGTRDLQQIRFYTRKLLLITYAATAVLNSLMLLFLTPILSLYRLSPETTELAYTLVMIHNGLAIFLWPLSFVFPNMLRACNDVRFPMVISIFSMFAFRIGFSYILGVGLGMGAIGVWIAMVIDWVFRLICFVGRYFHGDWKRTLYRLNP